jgi:hypothetical protein
MPEKERGRRLRTLRSVFFLFTLCEIGVLVNGGSYSPPPHSSSGRRSEVGLHSVILSVGTISVISLSYSLPVSTNSVILGFSRREKTSLTWKCV